MHLYLDDIYWSPPPRQQFVQAVDRVPVDHSSEHIAQISEWLDAVQFAGLDQRAQDRPTRAAAIAAGEQMILPPKCNGADRAFHRIGIEFHAPIVQELAEAAPAGERVTGRFGERAAVRHAQQLRFQPSSHAVDNWLGLRTPRYHPMRRRLTAAFVLDRVEFANPTQRLCRHRRSGLLLNLVKVASRVRPTRSKDNIAVHRQLLKAGVAIDVQDALEARKMRRRTLGFSVRRKQINGGRRRRATPSPLLACVY